ncbi:ATP-dependent DNA helicase [Lachnospiraceae bacterium BX10]|jgi:DNA excision repair protein ERCC-2|uniref:ATP-dependent DNA helicase n=3 Tax=Enterocloster TaxID=2719313 RepID=A0ABR7NUQ6_9FIRM|nr:ATP-dependent DNA helicase [Enterocloster hominis]MBC8599336.1 ATP-dependent DNA helicase [Enterocloster hominis]
MEQKKQVRISVRALVEFVLRSGDIDNRRSGAAQKDAMAAGTRIHKKIQKRMGGNYRAEVPLKYAALDEEEDIELLVEGRADGIFEEDGIVTIDEIKGVYMDLERLTEPVAVHMAQAMCYGYFYCCDRNLDGVRIQLTYCNLETEEIRRFHEDRSKEELEAWFRSVIHEYFKWARYLCHHELQRNQSISGLEFPFPYREGQRDLAVAVYKTISRKKRLFIQAPTGIGKTLSTIFPAVQAMGAGKASKVFYLTAKTITRTVAEEAFRILRSRGLVFTAVTITAKEKLCPMEKAECNPEACPYAKGHFDRVNEAVFDILHLEQEMDRETVLRYAEKYRVCPFEFCLDISSWTDGIICDYNYVFDPNVRLKRYFADGASGDYLFLVDEAHNLVSRAREMYSASVYKEDFLEVKRIIKGKSPRLERQLDRCNKLLLSMKRECGDWQLLEDVTGLAAGIMTAFSYMETFMEEFPEFPERETVLDFYFCLRDFLNVYEELDGHYRIYEENREDGSFLVRLFCVDPSRLLSRCMDQGASTILFSATLLPVRYYKTLLSGNQEDYAVYVNSPFPEENRLLMVAEDVSSRYTRRSPSEYRKVADYIRIVTQSRPGNYMVFFPSYQYMGEIEEILEEEPLKADLLVQGQGMGEAEKAEFLEEFEKERSHSLAAFCVMGGVFSEGIDLKEERLIGVIVVGTGLPMVCVEQEVLKGYFDETEEKGFDFSYQYPGMNKVLQAAGRVIRTPGDRGVILLLDDRFLRRDHLELFPREWEHFQVVNRGNAARCLEDFWNGRGL